MVRRGAPFLFAQLPRGSVACNWAAWAAVATHSARMASLGSSYVGPSLPSNCASRGFQEASRGCHGTLPPRITEYLRWMAEGRLRKLRVEREGKQNTSARERDAVVAHYTLCSAQGGPPLLSTRLSGDRGPRRWRCACGHEILTEGDEGEGLNVPAPAVDCAAMLMEEGEQAHFEALPELVAPREQIERGAVPTVTMVRAQEVFGLM